MLTEYGVQKESTLHLVLRLPEFPKKAHFKLEDGTSFKMGIPSFIPDIKDLVFIMVSNQTEPGYKVRQIYDMDP